MQNKTVEILILQDNADNTKKITFDIGNQNASSNQTYEFPLTDDLNNQGANNTLVSALATQVLSNKTLVTPTIKQTAGAESGITISADNITGNRTIRFPDADATLLSTVNVNIDDISFGSGIGAATLIGRTRQQQFFYAGF